jgi:hypothetical protein
VETALFRYYDSLGTQQAQSFDVLSVHGLGDPDKYKLVPPLIYNIVDGSKETAFKGFQRIITIELRALNAYEEFLRAFLTADTKSIRLNEAAVHIDSASIVYESSEFENEWIEDFKQAKRYVIELTEKRVRRQWMFLPSGEDMIYIKSHVKVIGTEDSPELFTTNAGKLAYNYGSTAFPDMLLEDYVIAIDGASYQSAQVHQVGIATQDGGDISFYLAYSNIGNASSDGYYYCDIVFLLQEMV